MPHFHQERTAITPARGFTWELQKGLTYFCFEPPWSPDTFCTANLVNPHAYRQKKTQHMHLDTLSWARFTASSWAVAESWPLRVIPKARDHPGFHLEKEVMSSNTQAPQAFSKDHHWYNLLRHCWTFRARLLRCCMVLDGWTQLQTAVAQKTKHAGKRNHDAGRQSNFPVLTTWKPSKIITWFVATTLLSITIWESLYM